MFIVLSIYLFIYWWWSLLICWITDVTFFCFSLIYLHTTPLCTNIYIPHFSIIEIRLHYDFSLFLSLSLSLRAVKYHRALGVLFWIFATLHMLIYQVKWLQKGTLATNAWQNVRNVPRNNIDIWRYLCTLFVKNTLLNSFLLHSVLDSFFCDLTCLRAMTLLFSYLRFLFQFCICLSLICPLLSPLIFPVFIFSSISPIIG